MSEVARVCGISPLEKRRTGADIYKLINGKIDCPKLLGKIMLKVPTFDARVPVSFHQFFSKLNYVLNSRMNQMLKSCNSVENFDFCCDSLRSLHI